LNDKQCNNGGVCTDNKCSCPDGTYGAKCDVENADGTGAISVCTTDGDGDECQNGGECISSTATIDGKTVDANYCKCPEGTFGAKCHGKEAGSDSGSSSTEKDKVVGTTSNSTKTTSDENGSSTNKDESVTVNKDESNSSSGSSSSSGKNSTTTNSSDSDSDSKNDSSSSNKTDGSTTTSGNKDDSTSNSTATTSGDKNDSSSSSSSSSSSKNDSSTDKKNDSSNNTGSKNNSSSGSTSTGKKTNENDNCSITGDECQNGGVCVLSSNGNYCTCPEGTSGTHCHGKGVCPLKCQHGSSCRHFDESHVMISASGLSETDFYCECVGKYKGLTCEVPFETCPRVKNDTPPECLNGGKCVPSGDPVDSYSCDCPDGWSGKSCEAGQQSTIVDWNGACNVNTDCLNGGLCIRDHDAKTTQETGMVTKQTHCLCTASWGGDNCEFECNSLTCQHGSSCRFRDPDDDAIVAGAYCDCKSDMYAGKECEIPVQKCPGTNMMECFHGGICVPSEESDFYFCSCPPGRKGERCEIQDNTVNPLNPSSGFGNNNSNNLSSNSNEVSSTSSAVPTPVAILTGLTLSMTLIALATFVFFHKRGGKRSAALEGGVEDFTNGGDKSTNESDGFNVTIEEGDIGEDVFDYDTNGVVDVNLDEPVELATGKQLV